MNRRDGGIFLCLCGVSLLLCGCRKGLCYDHDMHGLNVRVVVQPEWECVWERDHGMNWDDNWAEERFGCGYEDLCPDPATGIAAFVYDGDGSRTERHLSAEGGELPMSEGRKSILLHNDDTRFIVFSDMNSWASASATTRTRTRSTYSETHGDERTVNAVSYTHLDVYKRQGQYGDCKDTENPKKTETGGGKTRNRLFLRRPRYGYGPDLAVDKRRNETEISQAARNRLSLPRTDKTMNAKTKGYILGAVAASTYGCLLYTSRCV